jgi:hypothetical protein
VADEEWQIRQQGEKIAEQKRQIADVVLATVASRSNWPLLAC